jgi:hypothetical protein
MPNNASRHSCFREGSLLPVTRSDHHTLLWVREMLAGAIYLNTDARAAGGQAGSPADNR